MIGIDHEQGAALRFLHPALFHAWHVAESVYWKKAKVDAILTSGVDGEHSRGSKHYNGLAIDLRTRNVPQAVRRPISDEIAQRLGPEYDVVLESTHLHIELDPKQPINKEKWA